MIHIVICDNKYNELEKIINGEVTLAELAQVAENMGAPELPSSGKQEYLQNIINQIMFN